MNRYPKLNRYPKQFFCIQGKAYGQMLLDLEIKDMPELSTISK